MLYRKRRINRFRLISVKEFNVIAILFGIIFLIEFILGEMFGSLDILVIFTYFLYLSLLYILDTEFIVYYFWIIILASLNIIGVYVCENQGVYLTELATFSSYQGSLTPLVLCYSLFFSVIEINRLNNTNNDRHNGQIIVADLRVLKLVAIIGIAIELYLLINVIKNPYFVVGVERIIYQREYLTPLSLSLKSYLPFFIPIVVMCAKQGMKNIMFLFLILMILFYFLEGDKFGVYLFVAYILTLSYARDIQKEKMKLVVNSVLFLFCILIGVVYIQRVLLYDNDIASVVEYLNQRLAQQGEVWWSVYAQEVGRGLRLNELCDEAKVLFTNVDLSRYSFFGQWKMMIVSSNYSPYSFYRVNVAIPYTATTTASVFYYFKWLGLIVFYVLSALIYGFIIKNAILSFKNYRILESMIYVKLISIFNSLLTASDIYYLLSFKGLFYIASLSGLVWLRKKQIKIKFV